MRYSVCYHVERDGQKGFLKALDLTRADDEKDFTLALELLTTAFNFERDILRECGAKRMDRVIAPIDEGEVRVEEGMQGRVSYIIFEEADRDIRNQLAAMGLAETTARLQTLHHVATGLFQLHGSEIAHQDVKPSNVLAFPQVSKLSDLGRASRRNVPGPSDGDDYAGDKTYAPPELLYRRVYADFGVRRLGCDAYLFGSMVVFCFTGLSATALIMQHLNPDHHWQKWQGTYEDVFPYVRNAFGLAVADFASHVPGARLPEELSQIVRELCEPDPMLRGHPRNRADRVGDQYSMERYVSKFNDLAYWSRLGLLEQRLDKHARRK
ncbi:MAG: hypothetical protein ABSB87_06925 [Terriglobales bacterium]|jgi:serine/threonine protein kinase